MHKWSTLKVRDRTKGRITIRMWLSLQSAVQSFFRVFTQISPDFDTLGWKMGVTKYPLGGAAGKSGPNTSFIRNTPPWYGV